MSVAEPMPPEVAPPANGALYEVVNGRVVELPPMSFHSNKITAVLLALLWPFAFGRGFGVVVSETLFRIPLPRDRHRNRRPDVAYVSYERWPQDKPESRRDNAWDVVPDLAIEVVSPSDIFEELLDKVSEYLRAGVRQVWVVVPSTRQIHVYDAPAKAVHYDLNETIDGGLVLPGLRLPLKDVFIFNTIDEPKADEE